MLRIPTTTYNPFYDVYKPKAADNVNGLKADPGLYQLDIHLSSLKSLTNLVSSHYRTQQTDYRTQVADFKQSVKELNTAVAVLSDKGYVWDNNTAQTVAAVQNLATAYNKVGNSLSANNRTKRSERLLSGIQNGFAIRQNAFKEIGLALDEETGDIMVDQDKLSEALTADADKVKGLLSGETGFIGKLKQAAQELLNGKYKDYIKAPSIADSIDYGLQLKGQNYGFLYGLNSQYSSGLFFDMWA